MYDHRIAVSSGLVESYWHINRTRWLRKRSRKKLRWNIKLVPMKCNASFTCREGRAVQLHSLRAYASLNGEIGRCGRFKAKEGRHAVDLDNGRKVAVRPENLRIAPAPSSSSASKTLSASAMQSSLENLDLYAFEIGDSYPQRSDLCKFSQYSKIPTETIKCLFNELASSRYRSLGLSF